MQTCTVRQRSAEPTGFFDKNGKEIHEGDQLGHPENVVEFSFGSWNTNGDRPLWMLAKHQEVVGSIYNNRMFKHFDNTVPPALAKHILSFITFAKDNFISEFRDSANRTSILEIEGKPYNGFIPINCSGGFAVREEYSNDVDPCSHFTKEQSLFKTKQAAQSLVDFCANYEIDVDTALSEEYQEELTEWENDLHQPALLELRCAVRKGKVVIGLALDYVGGDVFNWNLLFEKECTVSEFFGLDFEGFFEELTTVVNELEK